jgi:hypothetical protein
MIAVLEYLEVSIVLHPVEQILERIERATPFSPAGAPG